MSDLLTNWGYTIENTASLPDLMTVAEFDALTGNKFAGDARVSSLLASAQITVRNFCGWHLYPSLPCKFEADSIDVSRCIQLPSRFVSGVSSVKLRDTDIVDYHVKTNGLVFLDGSVLGRSWNDVEVRFTSGLGAAQIGALKEILAGRIANALTNSYGVQSESAGGVSITYSLNWASHASAASITDPLIAALMPYKVQEVV
ncbi:MAG: hypothetical protein IIY21_01105 [Clostridiales bacterium]|nr:hypothetical protein [Clostridiales bacterium]MBQ1569481.1 hypothetical protein [Clostridiales bacterium]MBQ1572099.1 hypothetical protein [Clostridiales bacterium]